MFKYIYRVCVKLPNRYVTMNLLYDNRKLLNIRVFSLLNIWWQFCRYSRHPRLLLTNPMDIHIQSTLEVIHNKCFIALLYIFICVYNVMYKHYCHFYFILYWGIAFRSVDNNPSHEQYLDLEKDIKAVRTLYQTFIIYFRYLQIYKFDWSFAKTFRMLRLHERFAILIFSYYLKMILTLWKKLNYLYHHVSNYIYCFRQFH